MRTTTRTARRVTMLALAAAGLVFASAALAGSTESASYGINPPRHAEMAKLLTPEQIAAAGIER